MSKTDKIISVAGTEGTYEYDTHHVTSKGLAAVREYAPGGFRIRVEPATGEAAVEMARTLTREDGWKQPGDGGQNRFSKVVGTQADLVSVYTTALKVVATEAEILVVEEAALPEVVERHGLVREGLTRGVAGANSRWGLPTLRAKNEALRPDEDEQRKQLSGVVADRKQPGRQTANKRGRRCLNHCIIYRRLR